MSKTFGPLVWGVLVFGTIGFGRADEMRVKLYGGYSLADWSERIKSIPLDVLGNPEDVGGLTSIIVDESAPWADRRQAALTLGRIGRPAVSAVPLLLKLLNEEGSRDPQTRLWALKGLAYFGILAEAATPEVAKLAADREQSHLIRLAAMETLSLIGKQRREAVSTLIAVLNESPGTTHEELETRLVAVDALWYLGPGAASALPDLLRLARSDWSPLRLGTAQALGEIGPAAEIAVPVLVDMVLFDPAGEVREAAVDALAKLGTQGVMVLSRLFQDRDPDVRRLAVRGLKANKSPQAVAALATGFEDEDPLVAVEAAAAVAGIDRSHPQALDRLLFGLAHTDRHVRLTAYRSLQKSVDHLGPYAERLQRIADSPSAPEQSRAAAARLISQLPDSGTGP